MTRLLIAICFGVLSRSTLAQTFNLTVDASTCTAPSEYNTCWESAVAAQTTCIQLAGLDQQAVLACGCVGFIEQMNCVAGACWNRIYGCEYQSIVANYLALCPIAKLPVPYYPAPTNAPGSCSCNTGLIVEAYLGAESQSINCLHNATSMETLNNLEFISQMDVACSCCATSITISAMYDICPNTDPKSIGLNALLSAVAPFLPWPSCGASLQQFDCVKDLQFEAPLSTGSVYNPTNLPSSGTQTLSNIAGEVTSPASGSVFSYSAVGSEWTVTALSINDKKATTTQESSAGVGSSETESAAQGGAGGTAAGGPVATQGSQTTAVGGTFATGTSAGNSATAAKSEARKTYSGLPSLVVAVSILGAMMAS